MPLSDTAVRNAKPRHAPYKLADGEGMYLLVQPSGAKYWRLKYRYAGKEKVLALGVYPDVTLRAARDKRVRAAYHRSQYLQERRRMMQHWADYLEARKKDGKVVSGHFGVAA